MVCGKGLFDKTSYVKAKNIKNALEKGVIALKKLYKDEECENYSNDELLSEVKEVSFELNLTEVNTEVKKK